jgi:hypothetical protein
MEVTALGTHIPEATVFGAPPPSKNQDKTNADLPTFSLRRDNFRPRGILVADMSAATQPDTNRGELANDQPAALADETPVRNFQDVLALSLTMIDEQRRRIALALRSEAREARLDKTLSVEIKRLNSMIITYRELLDSPQAKSTPTAEHQTGAVSMIFADVFGKRPRAGDLARGKQR